MESKFLRWMLLLFVIGTLSIIICGFLKATNNTNIIENPENEIIKIEDDEVYLKTPNNNIVKTNIYDSFYTYEEFFGDFKISIDKENKTLIYTHNDF